MTIECTNIFLKGSQLQGLRFLNVCVALSFDVEHFYLHVKTHNKIYLKISIYIYV